MEIAKKKAGRSSMPEKEKKVQSYYYTKAKNKARIAAAVQKLIKRLDR